MRWVAIAALASGCGRFGFDDVGSDANPVDTSRDARICMPVGHDEDSDSIDDSCDVCPHIADSPQPDLDGDGVGDACDPEPANARQRIVLFDPMTTLGTNGWMKVGQVVLGSDEVIIGLPNTSGSYFRLHAAANDTFEIGGITGNANLAQQHLMALLTGSTTTADSYYCELYDGGASSNMFFTVTDGAVFDHPAGAQIPRFADKFGVLRYGLDPTDAQCATTWGGIEERVISAPRPSTFAPDVFTIYAENVELRVKYLLHITTM